eukprot:Hpha_TRINITY_DN5881_c0_g1::TRINITY_DN5881_c0_g1_i1::g.45496::m.45496
MTIVQWFGFVLLFSALPEVCLANQWQLPVSYPGLAELLGQQQPQLNLNLPNLPLPSGALGASADAYATYGSQLLQPNQQSQDKSFQMLLAIPAVLLLGLFGYAAMRCRGRDREGEAAPLRFNRFNCV